jgi:DNA-binding response OmpR family regulator
MQSLPIVLIVKDDHLIQSVVEEALTEGGFEIVIASSEEQAIELHDSADDNCRALVIDINLGRGRVDGLDCPRPQGDRPAFPVFYIRS